MSGEVRFKEAGRLFLWLLSSLLAGIVLFSLLQTTALSFWLHISLTILFILFVLIGSLSYLSKTYTQTVHLALLFSSFFDRLLFPRGFEKLLKKHIPGKAIMELGSSTQLLTARLQRLAPLSHCIVDSSDSVIRIRSKHSSPLLSFVHDPSFTSHLPPSISSADVFFGIRLLNRLRDDFLYLKQLNSVLSEGGRVYFLEYAPSPLLFFSKNELFSDTVRLKMMFKDAGFATRIIFIKKWYCTYMIIEGIKTDYTNAPIV